MEIGNRLLEWLGLKQFGTDVGDKINEADARIGLYTSACVAVIELIRIIMMLVTPVDSVPPDYNVHVWTVGHLSAYVSLFVVSIALFICSRLYLRGKTRNRWVTRVSVFAFTVVALAFGIYVSSIDYQQGRVLLAFATMVVLCSCLFIVIPVVTLCVNTVAFLVLFHVINAMTPEFAGVPAINLFTFWAVVLVVSIVRFNEKRSAVQAQFEISEQSLHDALTGLKNRRSLNDEIEKFEPGEAALLMLDVDDFKFFNDAYGHGVGDSVLKQFADALKSAFPPDSCYRSGGDEFLVLQRGVGEAKTREDLRCLHLVLGKIGVDGVDLLVSSSVGAVTGHVEGPDDLQDMLRVADIAMYEAKRRGKNRAVFKTYDASRARVQPIQTPRSLAYKIEETDLLTGLPNYTHFRGRAMRMLKNPGSFEGGVALVYFDIANFKAFNYEYGYEGGDAFLQSLADVLREVFRGQLVARFGEDRFIVLTDRAHVVERVVDAHERAHNYQRGITLELKAGICYPETGETDVSAIYDRAKLACDSIKNEFDQVYRVYDNELRTQTSRRNHIVNSLDTAIESGWIKVYYQPIMRTQTGKLCGVEALARWVDPELGMIGPDEFIGVLEQYHLIDRLDTHVLRTICGDYRKVIEGRRPPVPVSVNLSRLDFELCDIFDVVEKTTSEYGVPRSMLHLEVTESVLTDNSDLIKEQIARFREVGYQVWMDDFGSGYSSLNLLKEYDFDVLKIDMLFLKGLEEHESSRIIISSIVDMAKQLGIQTLAEGVETEEQLEFLQEIGCEKLQGYLFSRPCPLFNIKGLIDSGKMGIELMEDRPYYTETGKVNIIGRSPDRDSENEGVNTGVAPLAIIEYRDGRFWYLAANHSYRELMQRLGIGSLVNAEMRFDDGYNKPLQTFTEICRKLKHEGGVRSFDHITYGAHCNTRVSYIASDGDEADAFLICTISDADLARSTEESTLQETQRYIFSVYTRVDVIAEDNALMENIYLNSGQYSGEFVRDDARTSLADFARENIHPDDRERFLEYYDMETVARRVASHKLSHLSAFFRTVAPDSGYVWQLYLLIPMARRNRRFWLSCVRDVDPGAVRFVPEASGVTFEAMLWESLIAMDNVGIFWKDKDCRFLGANKAFMDFYGLESQDELIGKTDDEMGWNIYGSNVATGERRVIEDGEMIRAAHANCLAKGRPHEIVVNKAPLVDEGERVGLVGVFRMIESDEIDKVNILSFVSATSQYVRAYREDGVDFGFTCVEVAEAGKPYPDSFVSKIVKRLIAAAEKIVRNRGMVMRFGIRSFAIIMQLCDDDERVKLNKEYLDAFNKVKSVDGMPCEYRLKSGSAVFSEAGSLDNMVFLAERRVE